MATKLEYLQKYLAKPAEAAETNSERPKEKKKRKKVAAIPDAQTIQIRDLSEVLPKPRALAEPQYRGNQAKLLAVDLDEDDKRLVIDGELDYVEEQAVLEASKIDVEKSGVTWKISNHRKQPNKQALRSSGGVKAEIVKEVKEEESDQDLSPPRKVAAASIKEGSAKKRHDSDSDMSPPRKAVANNANEGGPTKRHDSDSDMSPPRKAVASNDKAGDAKKRHDSNSDLSPPRKAVASNAKARPTKRHDSDSDMSPPRKTVASNEKAGGTKKRRDSDSDMSPPRRDAVKEEKQGGAKKRHDSNSDMSPPRRAAVKEEKQGGAKKRHDSDSDISPPRRAGANDEKKGGAKKRHDSDSDMSPPRKAIASNAKEGGAKRRHDSDSDMSPPRKVATNEDGEEEKMSSGLRAGLVSGAALKEEAAKVREERKAKLEAMPDSQTGKNADTVYRNRSGGKIDREQWVEQQQKKRKKKLSEYPEQELAWGGGLKQQQSKEDEMAEDIRVSQLPFARFEPDQGALDNMHDKQAWHDPMSKFNDEEETGTASLGSQVKPAVKKPKCPHPPWPNRFGILPGYRWDGAVRGHNYEKRWLDAKNNREFMKTERYKWERMED